MKPEGVVVKSNKKAIWLGAGLAVLIAVVLARILLAKSHNSLKIYASNNLTVNSIPIKQPKDNPTLTISNAEASCSTTVDCVAYSSHIYLKFPLAKIPKGKNIQSVTLRLNA